MKRVLQASTNMVISWRKENLGLMLQTPERERMQCSMAIPFERSAVTVSWNLGQVPTRMDAALRTAVNTSRLSFQTSQPYSRIFAKPNSTPWGWLPRFSGRFLTFH